MELRTWRPSFSSSPRRWRTTGPPSRAPSRKKARRRRRIAKFSGLRRRGAGGPCIQKTHSGHIAATHFLGKQGRARLAFFPPGLQKLLLPDQFVCQLCTVSLDFLAALVRQKELLRSEEHTSEL